MTLALFNDFAYAIFYYLSAQKVKALGVSFEALKLTHRSPSHLLKACPCEV